MTEYSAAQVDLTFTAPADHPGESLVRVELERAAGGTKLVLVHERLADADTKASHEQGWAGCLAKWRRSTSDRFEYVGV